MSIPVTMITATYGRHRRLTEETIESFLRQNYTNKKLLIVNTHPDPIIFAQEYPQIEVQNIPDTFPDSLGQKLAYCFKQIETPLWGIMDDDDIFLPWHISNLVKHWEDALARGERRPICVHHENMIYWESGSIRSATQWDLWSCYLFEKPTQEFWDFHTAFSAIRHEDSERDIKIKNWSGWNKIKPITYPQPPGYIYRWGTDSRHLSGFGNDPDNQKEGYDLCRAEANEIRNPGPWRPHWDSDYVEDLKEFYRHCGHLTYNGRPLEKPEWK